MTRRRTIALLVLAAIVLSITAAFAWQWESIAYVDSGSRFRVQHGYCLKPPGNNFSIDYGNSETIADDGSAYEATMLYRRWDWLPVADLRVKVLRQIPPAELNH